MLRAAVDTNSLVSGTIARSPDSANAMLLDALELGRFKLVQSLDCLRELRRILALPHIRADSGWSLEEIDVFCKFIEQSSEILPVPTIVSPAIPRDANDAKFLDLALTADADYLVTNDRRHLLRLKKIGRTKIVTPHKFLVALKRSEAR